jgi:hypothetical protein
MFDNDHTDGELARREHNYEMGELSAEERAFERFCETATSLLVDVGVTTREQGLDGDQETDGFSLDFAYDWFRDRGTPNDYVTEVLFERGLLGFKDGDAE